MTWFKDNLFNLISIAIAAVVTYIALNDRITVLEQRADALERSQERIELTLQQSLSEIKTDIKEVNQKTDDLVKYLLPRQ